MFRFDTREGILGVDAGGKFQVIDPYLRGDVQKLVASMAPGNGRLVLINRRAKVHILGRINLVSTLGGDGAGECP